MQKFPKLQYLLHSIVLLVCGVSFTRNGSNVTDTVEVNLTVIIDHVRIVNTTDTHVSFHTTTIHVACGIAFFLRFDFNSLITFVVECI